MIEMDRVRAARELMEQSIREAVVHAVADFADSTGLTPEGIHVQMVSVHQIGAPSFHAVGSVDCRVVL
ncbi:hypothetical protein [Telluria beijingensis]|uniref:hypothetical protein n=1 Tax=Telluria beijingensis TaxID=3068633 RepID=UPI0027956211|nr:hypothetical protein [Massilia sp. REN29]